MKQPNAAGSITIRPKSLYRELTIALVLLVTLVSVAVSLANYFYSSQEADTLLESKVSGYTANLRESLEWPLWNIDDELIGKIGRAFATNEEIVSLTIRDDKERVVFHHEKLNGDQLNYQFFILHNGQNIGSVKIGLSLHAYEEKNKWLLFTSIATALLLIVSLLGALRWMLSRLLKKPLDVFIGATSDMVEGKYRQIALPETYVEFAPILAGFKTMSDAVASRESSLRQSNEQLATEIDERKRAEEALRASEALLQTTIKILPVGLWVMDEEGKIVFGNDAAKQIWAGVHYVGIEQLGEYKGWWLDSGKSIEPHEWAGARAIEKGEISIENEVEIECFDGTRKIILDSAVPLYNSDGNIRGAVTVNQDITERKRAEDELRKTQAKLIAAQKLAAIGSWEWDVRNDVASWSDETYRIFGIDKNELKGHRNNFLDMIVAEDRGMVDQALSDALSGVRDYDIEYRVSLADGSHKVIHALAEIIRDAEGKLVAMTGTVQDITERKRVEEALRINEERLKLATSAGNIGIWDWDVVRNVLTWDDSMYALYGIRKEEFGGAYDAWIATLHPEDRQFTDGEVQAALRGEREYAPEFRIIRPDGNIRTIKASSKTYCDPQGKPLRMVGTNFDITDIKQIEDELRKYKDHLEEEVQSRTADLVLARNAAEAANRAKSVFLSSMSHELRTPLNAILGFSGLMRKDTLLTRMQRENLDIINHSGEHLLNLINDVLEMAKIEAGRVQLESLPFDLGALVRDVTDMMYVRAQEKGLQLLVDQSSEFPRYIKGDEARVRQVLTNLVGNAVKFTQHGGITVRFGLKPHATPPRLLIEVEDSGIGISEADQNIIFDPFVQLEKMSTQTGTGLGLTITRQFVQLMRGAISVESQLGKGSIFRVELPVDKVAAADVLKPAGVIRGEIAGLVPGQPEYRILIVEDQLENQLLLARLMKNVGFKVKVAENGEQAVSLFQSWQPHLIWMDRRMPVMDGIEATRRIRELPGGHDVKIVAVTASAFTEQRDEILAAGMDDFVRKPYRFNEIYECLAKHLSVQYTYADEQLTEETSEVPLTAEMLTVLPQALRQELGTALESLEGERISAVIEQVASYDAELHKTLLHLAENFDYPTILKALEMRSPVT
jgi:PAS domain S-box-containing protein